MNSLSADQLGIEHQTVYGLPPVQFVELAAYLGCRYIAIGLTTGPYNPYGYVPYSLGSDVPLRRRMIAAMKHHGVSISLGEGFLVRPGTDVVDTAAALDVMAELGVARINTTSLDEDLGRSFDEFAILAGMVAERGMVTTIEFAPSLGIPDLPTALAAVRHVGRPDFRLLIDTMHLVRAGHSADDLAALDPALIGYVQLSDNTLHQRGDNYRADTVDRIVPGRGELPLQEILATVPPEVVIGLEVPIRSRVEAGDIPMTIVEDCVRAGRDLLTRMLIQQGDNQ